MKHYLIVGNGVAGATAAEQIRKLDAVGKITMFTQESHPFYYRPRLPEYLCGGSDLSDFTMHSLDKYRQLQIDLRPNENIVDINDKTVKSAKGETFPYDALLLACGASSNMPPLPGVDKAGVFTLRTVEDANAISKAASSTKEAILVGGGLLGLEAGHGLIKLGLKVQVVEFFDRLLPRQMDAPGAQVLQRLLTQMGFSFHLGAKAQEVLGAAKVSGLRLEDGTELTGGLLLFSAGIHPNLELAKKLKLNIDKAVVVDEHMRTSQAGIWAAGDVAQFGNAPGGIWPTAMNQGRVAGASMAGDDNQVYIALAPSTSLKVAGINLTSAGNIDAEDKLQAKRLIKGDNYRKIVLDGDIIKGLIFLGDSNGVRECTTAMNQAKPLGALAAELDREDFDFKRLIQ